MQTILVTGASRGLGFYFVKRYLETGNRVFAGVRAEQSEGLAALREQFGDALTIVRLDVGSTASAEEAAKAVTAQTDRLDLVINNAAIHGETSFLELEKTDLEECLPVYNSNAVGPLRVAKAFLPLLRKGHAARIINISSESGSIGMAKRVKEFDYCMSKAALNMATKLLSNDLKNDGISLLAVQPGWMRTDMGGANADLDPYETACKLVKLFAQLPAEGPLFVDHDGAELPW